ncbi:helix-turn-helix transcriptional regulator [Paraferrimonas haliotis]|uniref:AlpA family phage regulatory protein n=1 Tax=Paraferrimonas haliotis TaxID=2013866 RepID=A0AA37TRZ5_9GAMM|nr:AlpA family phage regulatory protein [Paraferrimonas haliotis]GLS83446.1 hypothetical protein GCM10007894_14230 [Paraferrimonas haliotis]
MKPQKILSITDVCQLVQKNRKTLWDWVKNGDFPKPIMLRGKTLGWSESTYNNWVNGASEQEGGE